MKRLEMYKDTPVDKAALKIALDRIHDQFVQGCGGVCGGGVCGGGGGIGGGVCCGCGGCCAGGTGQMAARKLRAKRFKHKHKLTKELR